MTPEIAVAFLLGNLTGGFAAIKAQPLIVRIKAAWATLTAKP